MNVLNYFLFIFLASFIAIFIPEDGYYLYSYGFLIGFVGNIILNWNNKD